MLRSSIGLGVAGLVFLGSIVLAYTAGASGRGVHETSAALVLTNGEVRLASADELGAADSQEIKDAIGGDDSGRGVPLNYFTYQGVITNLDGTPAVGPLSLRFQLWGEPLGGGSRVVLVSNLVEGIMPDEAGRFEAEAGLPFGNSMRNFKDFGLQILDGTDLTPIGGEIAVNPTPYAWLSEFSREAETLINDESFTIGYPTGFAAGPLGGGVPTATRSGNMVFLSGEMTNTAPNPNGVLVGTLPASMRPATSQVMTIHVSLSTTAGNAALRVQTNGEIRFISSNYSPGFVFFLNGACFPVE